MVQSAPQTTLEKPINASAGSAIKMNYLLTYIRGIDPFTFVHILYFYFVSSLFLQRGKKCMILRLGPK